MLLGVVNGQIKKYIKSETSLRFSFLKRFSVMFCERGYMLCNAWNPIECTVYIKQEEQTYNDLFNFSSNKNAQYAMNEQQCITYSGCVPMLDTISIFNLHSKINCIFILWDFLFKNTHQICTLYFYKYLLVCLIWCIIGVCKLY